VTFENIRLEQPEPGIHLLTIDRPKVLNALNPETMGEISRAVGLLEADADARVLLVTGSGDKAFVAGADISRMQAMTPLQAKGFATSAQGVLRRLERLTIPVIAVVNGYALGGGCELAMACDFIIAGEKAVFGQPEVNLGVPPGFGGTQRLSRLVGRGVAMELLMSARQVRAEEALALGLANHVYPQEQLMNNALELARQIAAKGPVAVAQVKLAVQRGQDLDLDNACALEAELFALTFSTADQREGMSAFLERRDARFQGR